MNWPDLSSFEATVGRLATAEDTRANRASLLLEVDGVRIGKPVDMTLPCFARYREEDSSEPKRAVIFQAEEADGVRYLGGWLIDDETQIVGFEDDFDLLTKEQIQRRSRPSRGSVDPVSLPPVGLSGLRALQGAAACATIWPKKTR